MSEHDAWVFLLSLATLLGVARLLGELARSVGLPLVVGELSAGVLLGPTVLGRLMPAEHHWLFEAPKARIMLGAYTTVAVVLLLAVAGLEIDLSVVKRRGRSAAYASLLGVLLPLAGGVLLGWLLPDRDLVRPEHRILFSLFLGVALGISALPVIAKTLIDLGLFKTDLGLVVMAAATIVDLVGWVGFSVLVGPLRGERVELAGLATTLGLAVAFVALSVTLGHRAVDALVGRIEAEQQAAPERVLSLVILLALLGGAATAAIGIPAIFGAFVVGITVGESTRLKERTRVVIHQFVTNVFAPVFFASLGLRVDFIGAFDLRLTLLILVVASVTKVVGCSVGARLGGLRWRESWAVGFGLNARGAMEIILALAALEAGLIKEQLLVALVVMALATSLVSGPAMKRLLYRAEEEEDVVALLKRGAFVGKMSATTAAEAIAELVAPLAASLDTLAEPARVAVLERELMAPTGLGDEVAIPHAAVEGLKRPMLALGRAPHGVDFDSPDGKGAKLVFLLLMPPRAYEEEVRVLASIARSIFEPAAREALLAATDFEGALQVLAQRAREQAGRRRPRAAASLTDL